MSRNYTLRCCTTVGTQGLAEFFALFKAHQVNIKKLVFLGPLDAGSSKSAEFELEFTGPEESVALEAFITLLNQHLGQGNAWKNIYLTTETPAE